MFNWKEIETLSIVFKNSTKYNKRLEFLSAAKPDFESDSFTNGCKTVYGIFIES